MFESIPLVKLSLALGGLYKFGEFLTPLYKDLTGTGLGHKFLEHEELGAKYVKDEVGHERCIILPDFDEICADPNKLQTVKDLLNVDGEHIPMMGMVNGDTIVYVDRFNRLIIKGTKSEHVRKIFGDETEYKYTFTVKTSQYHTYGTVSDKNSEKEYHFGTAPKSPTPLQISGYSHVRSELPHQLMYHREPEKYHTSNPNPLFNYASMEVAFDLNHEQLHKMHDFLDAYHQRANLNLEGYNLFYKNCSSFMSKVFQTVYETEDIKPGDFYMSAEMDLRDIGVFQQFVASRPAYITAYNIAPAFADLLSNEKTGKGIDELRDRWSGFIKHHTDKLTKLFYGEEDSLNELFYHAANDDVAMVAKILEQHPDLLNASDKYGYTPLHYALEYLCHNTAVYLIESGADLNAKDIRGFEALQKIFTEGFIGNFWQLEPYLDQHYKGSYDTFDTKFYVSPLISSALANEPEIIQWLVEHGSDISQTSTEGFNVAHTAAKAHNVEAFEFLKEHYHKELFDVIDLRYQAIPEELFDKYDELATERLNFKNGIELIQAVGTHNDNVGIFFEAAGQDQTDEMFQHIELPDSAVAA
jgi:hypothetical protein